MSIQPFFITKAQFGEEAIRFYAYNIDAIYHPRTTKIVLPANALISEVIHSLYDAYVRLTIGGGAGKDNHLLTKILPPPSCVM